MSGSAARSTSPTALSDPRRELVDRVRLRVPCGIVEVDDVDRRHAGAEERQVVVFDRRLLVDELAPLQPLRRGPDVSVSQRVEFGSRMMPQIAVADHVDQHQRADVPERAVLLRRLDIVAAAVGVIVVRVPVDDRLLAVEEQQLDRQRIAPVLEHRASSIRNAVLDPRVVGADEPERRRNSFVS